MEKLIDRLANIGIHLELAGNFPWIYLIKINGKTITEKYQSEYGFVIGYSPIRAEEGYKFTNLKEIFNLIRKYVES